MEKIIQIYRKNHEVISYLFWGILTTVINLGVFDLIAEFTTINYQINNVIAWIISALFAYFTNRKYVFESAAHEFGDYLKEFASFMIGGRLGSLVLEQIILYIGVTIIGINLIIAKIIGQIVVIIFNYLWSKLIVFKKD